MPLVALLLTHRLKRVLAGDLVVLGLWILLAHFAHDPTLGPKSGACFGAAGLLFLIGLVLFDLWLVLGPL
jgi:hypothetical protein